jgi:uncharacterized membrane protein
MQGNQAKRSKLRELLFRIAVSLKGLDGVLETAGGIALLVASPGWIAQVATVLTWDFLVAHPRSAVAHHLANSAQHLSTGSERFAAVYLLAHGFVKIGLVAALLKNQRWAYPTAMIVFGVFVVYQLHRFTITHAMLLPPLSLFDLVVIGLIWLEYRRTGRANSAGNRIGRMPAK